MDLVAQWLGVRGLASAIHLKIWTFFYVCVSLEENRNICFWALGSTVDACTYVSPRTIPAIPDVKVDLGSEVVSWQSGHCTASPFFWQLVVRCLSRLRNSGLENDFVEMFRIQRYWHDSVYSLAGQWTLRDDFCIFSVLLGSTADTCIAPVYGGFLPASSQQRAVRILTMASLPLVTAQPSRDHSTCVTKPDHDVLAIGVAFFAVGCSTGPLLLCSQQHADRSLTMASLTSVTLLRQARSQQRAVEFGFCYPVNRPFTMCHPLTLQA